MGPAELRLTSQPLEPRVALLQLQRRTVPGARGVGGSPLASGPGFVGGAAFRRILRQEAEDFPPPFQGPQMSPVNSEELVSCALAFEAGRLPPRCARGTAVGASWEGCSIVRSAGGCVTLLPRSGRAVCAAASGEDHKGDEPQTGSALK